MSIPVLTFFNNNPRNIVREAADGNAKPLSSIICLGLSLKWVKRWWPSTFDPQANLHQPSCRRKNLRNCRDTGLRLPKATTIYRCVQPLMEVGNIPEPITQRIRSNLHLVPENLPLLDSRIFFPKSGQTASVVKIFSAPTAC